MKKHIILIGFLFICKLVFAQNVQIQITNLESEIKKLKQQIVAFQGQLTSGGIQGPKGDKGDKGDKGEKGDRGFSGDGAEFTNISSGDGFFSFKNKRGIKVATYGCSDVGSGLSWFFNEKGEKVAYIGAGSQGSGLSKFWNIDGKEVAYIGTSTNNDGLIQVNGRTLDYAEVFEFFDRKDVVPGTVMSMSVDGKGIMPSSEIYDSKVVGVISGAGKLNPGMIIGTRNDNSKDLPIAVSGQVYVRVCTEGGNIRVGDLLVASSKKGVAMKSTDKMKAFGAVIGKALQSFSESNEGLILMLVMTK